MKKSTKEEFIGKAKIIHKCKYDYAKVNYVNSNTKVCIICPVHGEFWQTPHNHIQGSICPKCAREEIIKKTAKSTEEFIKESIFSHGDKYDYSKVRYVNNHQKVKIICPIHGEIEIFPSSHINGYGCPKCAIIGRSNKKMFNTEEFIDKAKKIHGNKYNYSKTKYNGNGKKVTIICPKHGEFSQVAETHISGHGCPKCAVEERALKKIKDKKDFIKNAKEIHGDKYDYSKVEYKGMNKKVILICKQHGDFLMRPSNHLHGQGCPKCKYKLFSDKYRLTTEEFVLRSKKAHGSKYDYSKVKYEKINKKVCIICPVHGEFWQTPDSHINGQGCPHCNESKMEKDICDFLKANKLSFEYQKHFEWLGKKSLDFFLPNENVAIECQGGQHFFPIKFFGGKTGLENTIKRDKMKKILCDKNGIRLLYYSDIGIDFPYDIIDNKERLLNEING